MAAVVGSAIVGTATVGGTTPTLILYPELTVARVIPGRFTVRRGRSTGTLTPPTSATVGTAVVGTAKIAA